MIRSIPTDRRQLGDEFELTDYNTNDAIDLLRWLNESMVGMSREEMEEVEIQVSIEEGEAELTLTRPETPQEREERTEKHRQREAEREEQRKAREIAELRELQAKYPEIKAEP